MLANPGTVGGWVISSAGTLAFCIEQPLIFTVHLLRLTDRLQTLISDEMVMA